MTTFTARAATLLLVGTAACFPGPLDVIADIATDTASVADADGAETVGETTDDVAGADVVEVTTDADSADSDTPTNLCFGVVCDPPTACYEPGICDPASGLCDYAVSPGGTACDDGVRCMAGDACSGAVCAGTRQPRDRTADFASVIHASNGLRIRGLERTADEIIVLVEFPSDDASTASVDFGAPSGDSNIELFLPSGAQRALAIGRYSLGGAIKDAVLVASSTGELVAKRLQVHPTGTGYRVTASFTGSVDFPEDDYMITTPTSATFSARLAASTFVQRAYIIENGSIDDFNGSDDIIVAGSTCIASINVQGGRSARLMDDQRETLATFTADETHLVESHLAWLPACANAVNGRRAIIGGELVGATAAGFVFNRSADVDGSLVVGGVFSGKLQLAGGPEPVPIAEVARISAYVLAIGANHEIESTFVLDDDGPTGGVAPAVHTRDGELALSFSARGVGNLETTMTSLPLSDNPVTGEIVPRAVTVRARRDGTITWMKSVFSDDRPFQTLGIQGARTITAGRVSETTYSEGDLDVAMNGGSYVVGELDHEGEVWTIAIDQEIGTPVDSIEHAPIFVLALEPTPSVVVAGTLMGPIRFGSARQRSVQDAVELGFITRVNSDDGIGCPAE